LLKSIQITQQSKNYLKESKMIQIEKQKN